MERKNYSLLSIVLVCSLILLLCFGIVSAATTIIQNNITENLGDAMVKRDDPNSNFGSGGSGGDNTIGNHSAAGLKRMYFRFNTSGISDITDITFNVFSNDNDLAFAINFTTHEVYNLIWDEDVITWNNQPCGTDSPMSSSNCNSSSADIILSAPTWYRFNISSMINSVENNGTLSLVIKMDDEGIAQVGYDFFDSKEWGTPSQRPYLNITTADPPAPTIEHHTSISNSHLTVANNGRWRMTDG